MFEFKSNQSIFPFVLLGRNCFIPFVDSFFAVWATSSPEHVRLLCTVRIGVIWRFLSSLPQSIRSLRSNIKGFSLAASQRVPHIKAESPLPKGF